MTISLQLGRCTSRPVRPLRACAALFVSLGVLAGGNCSAAKASGSAQLEEYLGLALSELLSVEVSLAARRPQQLLDAAAAVHVIGEDDIRRSGAQSIPELLRMVPGVNVARINNSSWAVTARGFNGAFSNKLLVLIDGRSVYTPAFSGVYWDVQDTLIEDIERIEVIRGPGATLWGANAVNGIINVVTKGAEATVGGIAAINTGSQQRINAGMRYGWEIDGGAARAFVKYFELEPQKARSVLDDAGDQWDAVRGGFRVDRRSVGGDEWTLQGDLYHSRPDQLQLVAGMSPIPDEVRNKGWNVLGRWNRTLDDGSALRLQAYYDHNERDESAFGQRHQTLDVDFQHRFRPASEHELVWGLAYRSVRDDFDNTPFVSIEPSSKTSYQYSFFVQDEMTLVPERLRLIAGAKVGRNEHTGFEVQPSLRLAWHPTETQTAWTAVSRAIRSPSRMERYGRILSNVTPGPVPLPVFGIGSSQVDSEELIAYEAGYRRVIGEQTSIDVALFYHRYKRIVGNDFTGYPANVLFDSSMHAKSHGLEIAADWHPSARWELKLAYSAQEISAEAVTHEGAPFPDLLSRDAAERSTPHHQFSLFSKLELSDDWQLDAWLRHVGEVGANRVALIDIPSYTTLDLRVAWQAARDVEISLVGQNLLDPQHPEFVQEALVAPAEIERAVFARVRLDF